MQTLASRFFNPQKIPEIRLVFRVVECMYIALLVVMIAIDPQWQSELKAPWPEWVIYICLVGLFGLSWIYPNQQPGWQRRLYIILAGLLIILPICSGASFDLLLYLLIAKACFLLSPKDLLTAVLGLGATWSIAQIWLIQVVIIPLLNTRPAEPPDPQRFFFSAVFASLGNYIIICTFVLLLSLTILREQHSRLKAQQLMQEVESLAAALERSRIAREIHDALGHTLTSLNVQIELAERLQQRDPARSAGSMGIAKQLANQCLQDVRHAVQTMKDTAFDLNVAIQGLIEPMQMNSHLKLQTAVMLPTLSPMVSHQIYCIVQEGLTNIQRHAQASVVDLRAELVGQTVMVVLRDNGVGFDLSEIAGGFGLRSMTERAQLMGGRLEIQSGAEGTHLCLMVPL